MVGLYASMHRFAGLAINRYLLYRARHPKASHWR